MNHFMLPQDVGLVHQSATGETSVTQVNRVVR